MKSGETDLNFAGTEEVEEKRRLRVSMATGDPAKTLHLVANVLVRVFVYIYVNATQMLLQHLYYPILSPRLRSHVTSSFSPLAREKTVSPASRETWVSRETG